MDGDLPTEDFHLISSCPCWAYTSGCYGLVTVGTFSALLRSVNVANCNQRTEPGVEAVE